MSYRLSVVVPAFNAETTIARAVESAFKAGAIEVIVVDDGSSDRTAEFAAASGADVIRQPNAGAAVARRVGFQLSTGNYIIFLDSDDRIIAQGLTGAIDKLVNEQHGVICCRTIGKHSDGTETKLKAWSVPVTTMTLLERGYGPSAPCSVIWTRGTLDEVLNGPIPGLWPKYAEDYELLIRASLITSIGDSEEFLGEYSMSGGKSALGPINSVNSAEDLRAHYAQISGIRLRLRNRRARLALAIVRRASGQRRASIPWMAEIIRAGLTHPPTVIAFARQSIAQKR